MVVPLFDAAHALGQLVVQAVGHVPGAGEHHVLEQVREPGAARHLVLRADVVPDVHRDGRRRPVRRQDHRQPVRQRVGLERDLDRVGAGRRGARRRRLGGSGGDQGQEKEGCGRKSVFHRLHVFSLPRVKGEGRRQGD